MKSGNLSYRLWEGWKRVGRKIGDAQARILLTVFFFTIVAPFALVIRFWSDPLRLKGKNRAGWIPRVNEKAGIEKRALEQF